MPASPEQLPFSEAIDFFKKKVKLPSSGWTDIYEAQHSHAFVVSGASHDALVEDFYNAIVEARDSGKGYVAFRESFNEIVEKHGWAYNGTPGWRSKIIYDTNIKQSYNAGRYQQMMAVVDLRPFWQYDHTSIEHPRLEHQAWDGLILDATDPWWHTHYPQNGWGCNCKVYSLSRTAAKREWEARGKAGPDTAPPIEWEERVVGKNGSNPRTVRTPKGIDPGFAYNPGKAYLEPHTVPPLTGYDAVLKERGAAWPTGFEPPKLPTPSRFGSLDEYTLPADTPPRIAVSDFLEVFGASIEHGAVHIDAAGSAVAITKALFVKGDDKDGDVFKWLADPSKADRLQYVNLLAMALIEPDEIWWNWERDSKDKGKWRLRRRYLRIFEFDDGKKFAISAFEWGKSGWTGSTAFVVGDKKLSYFDKQRKGRLMYKKKTQP